MPARSRRLPHIVAVAAGVTLAAGCGGTAEEPTVTATDAPAAVTTGPATAEPEAAATVTPTEDLTEDAGAAADGATVVEIGVAGGSVTTAESRVEVAVGTTVRLVVTSDTDDELHVHGVDVEVPVAAGQPAVLDFVPPEPGVYDVETHDSHLQLVQIVAR